MNTASRPGTTFLVVDDSKVSRHPAIGLLAKGLPSAEFLEAGDGETAVALFQQTPAQVVVMDYNMPGIRGVEAALRIRALDPKVTVVLLTANGQAAVRARAEEAVLHMLCKPISGTLADQIVALAPALASASA
jgi:CheY-like chemotaxis protein